MTNLAPPNNSLALASFILGAIAVLGSFLSGLAGAATPFALALILFVFGGPGILAIVFGFIGISKANRLDGKRRPLAIWGTVLGFLVAPALVAGMLVALAIQR